MIGDNLRYNSTTAIYFQMDKKFNYPFCVLQTLYNRLINLFSFFNYLETVSPISDRRTASAYP